MNLDSKTDPIDGKGGLLGLWVRMNIKLIKFNVQNNLTLPHKDGVVFGSAMPPLGIYPRSGVGKLWSMD